MPLQRDRHKLCFIGDSQMGSLQKAVRDGLTQAPPGVDVEFWGVPGALFRQIHWHEGGIVASGDAAEMVKTVNESGRTSIRSDDFDTLVFYGARLRVAEFFGPYLDWAHIHGGLPSRAVLKATAKEFVWETRAYRMAQRMAEAGRDVIYVPGPFYTEGITDMTAKGRFLHAYPGATKGTAAMRDAIWCALEDVSADMGITLIRQPKDTITKGVLTKNEYACEGAFEDRDVGHKSSAFAARWMQEVWPQVQSHAKAA